ncbi:MAG: hypothetical protein CMQ43_00200 [Gammaproteobacteria bacterium]|nr:hypothetical protein [Gammaproteobacteria bacterium]|tara:strand:+ start:7813 stop:9117 length:1305 start_codon:yes stop_codon:yes gene_type:complete
MTAAPVLADFEPLDRLETNLVASWRDVSRAEHRFLQLLREFDLRRGWEAYGNNDCAEWLDWRCGISRTTAQEKVRVARALWFLPQIDEAFRVGDLSYSKVRALTRVATETTETELLAFALDASAAQCEIYCRRLRNGDPVASAADARRLHEGRSLVRHFREDGSGTLSVELPAESLELVMTALERVAARLPEDPDRSLFASGADALVQMAREALTGSPQGSASSDEHQVVVHVDATALAGQGGESELPLPMVKRLCCDGAVVPVLERDGVPLNVGRKQRTVPTAIKRALMARDRACTFPGCHHQRFLEAHHVHHWADGGETSLGNLLLLCSTHHTLIHEGGFSVRRHPDGTVYFSRPDGRPVAAPSAEGGVEVREGRVGYRVITSSAEGSILGFGANVSAPSDSNWPVRAICRIAAFRPLREEDRSLQASQPGG